MYKKILAITFAVMFLASILSVGSTITPAFAVKQNNHHKNHLPKLSDKIPFGTNNIFGITFGNLSDVAVNENNHRVYAVANDTVYVIDGKTDSFITSIPIGLGAGSIIVNEKTNRIYVANSGSGIDSGIFQNFNGTVSVIDGKTNAIIDTIPVNNDNLNGIGVNEKTNRIYVNGYYNHTSSVIDGNTDKVIDTFPLLYEPGYPIINEKTNKIYELNYGTPLPNGTIDYDGNVEVFNGKTDKHISTIGVDGAPTSVALNEKTDKLYVSSEVDGTVTVIDGKTNTVIDDVSVSDYTYGVAASESLNKIYVTNTLKSTLSVINGNTDKVLDTVPFGTPTPSCFFKGTCFDLGTWPSRVTIDDKLGQIYVLGSADGILYVFDTLTHHKIGEIHMGHGNHH
jgi:YVTN family beta-propeller protein